ncbi:hypothetical protein [Thalassolituus hydrocarboniclasticus]|uniref:Uncharacterized protein n=1 Tax=Thalassolituus hydrocarboniclasticus TaxID=2742796 RepID=A0ABY6AGU5_9GAMM|nr:hypothetical protein [Thalassolituus hydrocarboniclasticus]UXD89034.1 hypothetical protein HUF19_17020 [Thalassolituus hydrocarboniclasticus]
MKPAIYISALLPVIAAALAPAAQASSGDRTVCSHGNLTRIIEVKYTGEGTIPCEVHYTKDSGSQVLWSAQTEGGYCEQKAAEFVEKQRGWGWECETTVAATETPTTETPAAENTAAVSADESDAGELTADEVQAEDTQPDNMQTEETAATAE